MAPRYPEAQASFGADDLGKIVAVEKRIRGLVPGFRIAYRPAVMAIQFTRDRDGNFILLVPLDDTTATRLMTVADMSHAQPAEVAASIIHEVLADDEAAHLPDPSHPFIH